MRASHEAQAMPHEAYGRRTRLVRRGMSCIAVAALLSAAAGAVAGDIPARPEQLTFPKLDYSVPDAKAMRVTLSNKVPVYVAEDRLLPLISIQVYIRGGSYLDPAGKEGLAELTGTVWRTGGAGALDAKTLDEELDFLAAQLSTNVGDTTSSVSLNLLSKDVDKGLSLLMDVLTVPRFEEARLEKAKEDELSAMKRRNDDTSDIERREWSRLVYGDDYFLNRLATKKSIDGIAREDLVAFHKLLTNPANFVIAVAGDFDRRQMIAKLNTTIGAMKASGPPAPPVPQPEGSAEPAVYLVNKPDVNQGRVSIGHLGLKRPVPDEFSLQVANDILGGGGFTAWMMSRVRSDEGLAYSAYSGYGIGDVYPGVFRAFFQSKSATCARAAMLTAELIDKIRGEDVTDKELSTSKSSFIETLPRTFESKFRTVSRFALDDLTGRPHAYWTTYRERMGSVDVGAVKKAAQAHIHRDGLIVLVVGNVEEILKGHPDFPDIQLAKLGKLVHVPLRDPMTLEPLADK